MIPFVPDRGNACVREKLVVLCTSLVYSFLPSHCLLLAVMNIFVNNKPVEVPDDSTVAVMLSALQLAAGNGTALAVNSDVIARADWENRILQQNDKIIIIKATQGG